MRSPTATAAAVIVLEMAHFGFATVTIWISVVLDSVAFATAIVVHPVMASDVC